MLAISQSVAEAAGRKTELEFASMTERHGPLDPLTAMELHRALWTANAGAFVVNVIPDRFPDPVQLPAVDP